jgi:hypothetical protein
VVEVLRGKLYDGDLSHITVRTEFSRSMLKGVAVGWAAREAEKEAALAALPAEYYQPDHDPVLAELQKLPPRFDPAVLDQVVEERAAVLEVPSPPSFPPLSPVCVWVFVPWFFVDFFFVFPRKSLGEASRGLLKGWSRESGGANGGEGQWGRWT